MYFSSESCNAFYIIIDLGTRQLHSEEDLDLGSICLHRIALVSPRHQENSKYRFFFFSLISEEYVFSLRQAFKLFKIFIFNETQIPL